MMRKKHMFVISGILAIFLLGLFIFLFKWLHPDAIFPEAKNGSLDAKAWNFAKRGIIPLKGEWEFYEDKLLSPADFANGAQEADKQMLKVPGDWQGTVERAGRDGFGVGTYRLVVDVSKPDIYGLRLKKVRMSSRVFINGVDLGGSGTPSLEESVFYASNFPFYGIAKSESDKVEIIIQVASLKYLAGGIAQTPEFGPGQMLLDRRDNSRLADMVQISVMLLFTLYYVGMIKHWRTERHLMYFSLFCLGTGFFFSIDNEILLSSLFPGLSFPVLQKLIFVSVFLSFICFGLYIYAYLGLQEDRFFRWLKRVTYVFVTVACFTPNDYLRLTVPLYLLLQITTFFIIIAALFRSWRKGTTDAVYLMLGLFFLIVSWATAQFRYEIGLDNPYYMIVAPLLLVFSQAFLMSNRIQQAFIKNDRLSRQLIEYDRQKDEFMAKTSHELRTPLHGIMNLSQSLLDERGSEMGAKQREDIRLLNLVSRRLAGLVHDILDMSLIKRGQLRIRTTPVDVRMTTRFVIETLSITPISSQTVLIDDLPADLPLVWADENRLKQILYNLLENGLKFTEKGTVRISAERRGEELAISVIDTGIGIPEEARHTIFLPFEQYREEGARSAGGIGLGLSITKQLIELQGGILDMESEVGQGTRFTFTLPIARQDTELAEQRFIPEPMEKISLLPIQRSDDSSAPFSILIIDDEPSNVVILIHAVTSLGYGYTAVQRGSEALGLLQNGLKPDLALVDLMMPGVSGLDVCKEIRSSHSLSELPVLMLTASGQRGDVMASFAAGANDILQKPFELEELKARMQSLLAMKRSSEQAVRKEIDFLQAQITPHFLYNSMNALIGLSYKDVDKLRETIHHLTTYLRAKFTFSFQGQLVSFQQELELVKAYLAIEQLRFGSRLNVIYDVEDDLTCMLPPLTLQPLVENAVRHGIGPKEAGGTVWISVSNVSGDIHFKVEDDGVGMDQETLTRLEHEDGTGIGVGNVKRRLQMIYYRKLEVSSVFGQGTQVKFTIPEEFHDQSRLDR
ncbi:ATP-binding protein [Paenibacillus thalictri]|nr:ATP-binding protein [Paenibacillus thalictri]